MASELNRGKFKELVLFLAERSGDDPRMSRVKLNKLLYRADFEAYRILGSSITGATYLRGEHGPMAEYLPLAEEELGRAGLIGWRVDDTGTHDRKVPLAKQAADRSLFTPDELQLIERVLEELLPHGGRSVSEWSHKESAGWNLVKDNEPIPYSTAFISTKPIPAEDIERARELAIARDWASIRP